MIGAFGSADARSQWLSEISEVSGSSTVAGIGESHSWNAVNPSLEAPTGTSMFPTVQEWLSPIPATAHVVYPTSLKIGIRCIQRTANARHLHQPLRILRVSHTTIAVRAAGKCFSWTVGNMDVPVGAPRDGFTAFQEKHFPAARTDGMDQRIARI